MLSRKVLESLYTLMALLVLFEKILRQILFKFCAHNSESFNKGDVFCSHIFDLYELMA